jgi:hypothetical protein
MMRNLRAKADQYRTIRSAATKSREQTMGNDAAKDEYRAFCNQEDSLPLFARDWWLDAAVGRRGWDVVLVKSGNLVVASMPYTVRNRYGMRIFSQPALTPLLGPWFRKSEDRPIKQLCSENELMQALIDQLPRFDHFAQTWHPNITNWQPFYWNGFSQTTYYTHILKDLTNTEKLWDGLDSKVRRIIHKAHNEYRLEVRDDLPLEELLKLNHKTFDRQGLSPPYADEFVRRLDQACVNRGCRKLFITVDRRGVPLSGDYCVWDQNSAYNLLSGTDPVYRQSGANSLCLWESIRHAANVTRQYNFCGSMIEPLEVYLRSFGGVHVPYSRVSKTPSFFLRIRESIMLLGKNR